MSDLINRRRFAPYNVWSQRSADFWDDISNFESLIASKKGKISKDEKSELKKQLQDLRENVNDSCQRIFNANWRNVPLDPEFDVSRIEIRGFAYGEFSFETYCVNANKLLDELEAELEEVPPLPDTYDFIGTDSSDGLELYYDEEGKEYVKMIDTLDESEADWMKDGELLKEIKRNEYLEITITYSLETDSGHERFDAEITLSTKVKEMDSDDIKRAEKQMFDLANDNRIAGFEQIESDVVLKVGAEYTLGGRASEFPKVDIVTERNKPSKRSYGERTTTLWRWKK